MHGEGPKVLTRPLREQLREKVQDFEKRRVEASQACDVAESPAYEAAGQLGRAYAPGETTALPAVAIMPRVGELEDARQSIERQLRQLGEAQVETDSRIANALAQLARLVGVNPADIGL